MGTLGDFPAEFSSATMRRLTPVRPATSHQFPVTGAGYRMSGPARESPGGEPHMRQISKRAAVIATTAVLVVGGGVAYAAWTADGAGTASASAGHLAGLTGTAGTAGTAGSVDGLYPGGKVT